MMVDVFLGVSFAEPPVGSRRWQPPLIRHLAAAPTTDGGDGDDDHARLKSLEHLRRTITLSSTTEDDDSAEVETAAVFGTARFRPNPAAAAPQRLWWSPRSAALHERRYGPQPTHGEDCLYLNIWTPADRGHGLLPVLVVVPGGAFVHCWTSSPVFDPLAFVARERLVVVTVAYRVGLLGYLLHDSDEATPSTNANLGLLDIIAALQWVRRNIKVFGGDPANVTAWGNSAGAISLNYLMFGKGVPMGLFDRVILESGVAETTLPRTRESARKTREHLIAQLASSRGVDASSIDLQSVPVEELMKVQAMTESFRPRSQAIKHGVHAPAMFGPIHDEALIDHSILSTLRAPSLEQIRNGGDGVLIGSNDDEGTWFVMNLKSKADVDAHLAYFPHAMRDRIVELYGPTPEDGSAAFQYIAKIVGDLSFNLPITRHMHDLANMDAPSTRVFAYQFSHPPTDIDRYGIYHTLEIPYVFSSLLATEHEDASERAAELRIAREVGTRWARFIRGGEPWTALGRVETRGDGVVLVVGKEGCAEMRECENRGCWRDTARCEFAREWWWRYYYGDEEPNALIA